MCGFYTLAILSEIEMINGKTVLAVILARGGSKRCPGKNLRDFRGQSLLDWAMSHAKGSKYIDRFVVSSDDNQILDRAFGHGLVRPAELATDDASSEDAIRHAMSIYPHDWIVLLQPTSPLRTAADIDACIERAQLGYGCISTFHGKTNGAVYVATAEWLAVHDFSHLGLMKYEMPEERSLDIDYPEDFE